MRTFYITSFVLLLVCGLFACGNKNSNPTPASITGTWNLQKQEVKTYVNGSLQSDSVYNASADRVATLQFNADRSFTSNTFIYGTLLGQRTVIASGKTTGTYTYAGSAFSMSNLVTGLGFAIQWLNSADIPTIQVTSQTEQVVQLTANGLKLNTDVTENYTVHSATSVYHIMSDYVYSR